jgi:hypothetical protein
MFNFKSRLRSGFSPSQVISTSVHSSDVLYLNHFFLVILNCFIQLSRGVTNTLLWRLEPNTCHVVSSWISSHPHVPTTALYPISTSITKSTNGFKNNIPCAPPKYICCLYQHHVQLLTMHSANEQLLWWQQSTAKEPRKDKHIQQWANGPSKVQLSFLNFMQVCSLFLPAPSMYL